MKAEDAFVVVNSHRQEIVTVHAAYKHAKKMMDLLNEQSGFIVTSIKAPYSIFSLKGAVDYLLNYKETESYYSRYGD